MRYTAFGKIMLASDVGREVGSVINLSVRGRWIGRVYRAGRRRTEDESPPPEGAKEYRQGQASIASAAPAWLQKGKEPREPVATEALAETEKGRQSSSPACVAPALRDVLSPRFTGLENVLCRCRGSAHYRSLAPA